MTLREISCTACTDPVTFVQEHLSVEQAIELCRLHGPAKCPCCKSEGEVTDKDDGQAVMVVFRTVA